MVFEDNILYHSKIKREREGRRRREREGGTVDYWMMGMERVLLAATFKK